MAHVISVWNRKISDYTGWFPLVMLIILAMSCSMPFDASLADYLNRTGKEQHTPQAAGADAAYGSLRINDQRARTVLPSPVLPENLEYTIGLVSSEHGEMVSGPHAYDSGGFFVEEIPVGTWNVYVTAAAVGGGPTIFSGSALGVVIAAGDENSIHISLTPTQEGSGTLDLEVSWPAALVDSHEIQWRTERGAEPLVEADWPFTALAFEAGDRIELSIQAAELDSGTYFLRVLLKNSEGVLVATVTEIVVIYDEQESSKLIALEERHISKPPAAAEMLNVEPDRDPASHVLNGINLSWIRGSHTETGFRIYRSINAGEMVLLDETIPGDAVSWTDTAVGGLISGDTLVYELIAYNSFGSAPADTSAATTLYSLSFNDNGASSGGAALPDPILYFDSESVVIPEMSALLRGPELAGEHDGSGISQRLEGWSYDNGVTIMNEGDELEMTQSRVLEAIWTTGDDVIAKVGPAGGAVFYDKGNDTNGWRYMEVASFEHETAGRWQDPPEAVGGTLGTIGAGKFNTARIVAWVNALAGREAKAATDSDSLSYSSNGFVYNDWFLPSNQELQEIYSALLNTSAFDFSTTYPRNLYYSSTEFSAGNMGDLNFNTGVFTAGGNKDDADKSIRPVRAFRSSAPTYIVTYHPNGATAGSVPQDDIYYEGGESIILPSQGELFKDNHTFIGWSFEPGGAVISDSHFDIAANVVLYARWAPLVTGNLTAYNGQTGFDHFFTVEGATSGSSLWGSDIYTSDSSFPRAVVHSGVIEEGQTAMVKVRMLETSNHKYLGVYRNDIQSSPYDAYTNAFQVASLVEVYPPYFLMNDGPEYQLTIATSSPGASIRYTTNGDDPSTGNVYSGPVLIGSDLVDQEIRTRVEASGLNPLEREVFVRGVSFDVAGGEFLPQIRALHGQQITLPTPSRDGYSFIAWYDNPEFDGSALDSLYHVQGTVTLYAKWGWNPSYYAVPDTMNQRIVIQGQADIELTTLVPAISGEFWAVGQAPSNYYPTDMVQDSSGNWFVAVSTATVPATDSNRGFSSYSQSFILKIPSGNPSAGQIVFPEGDGQISADLPDIPALTISHTDNMLYFFAAKPVDTGANARLWALDTDSHSADFARKDGTSEYLLYGDNSIKYPTPTGMAYYQDGSNEYIFVVAHNDGTRLERVDITDFNQIPTTSFIPITDPGLPSGKTFFDIHTLDGMVYVTAPVFHEQTMYYASSEAPLIIRFTTDLSVNGSIGLSVYDNINSGLVKLYYPQRFVHTYLTDALYFIDGGGEFYGQDFDQYAQHPAYLKRLFFKEVEDEEFDSILITEDKSFWGYYLHFSCGL